MKTNFQQTRFFSVATCRVGNSYEKNTLLQSKYCLIIMFMLFAFNSNQLFAEVRDSTMLDAKDIGDLHINQNIKMNVQDAVQWHNWGVESLKQNKFHEATGRFAMSIQLYGNYHDMDLVYYHYFQALICKKTQESLEEAEMLYTQGKIKTSAGRFVNYYIGYLYYQLGDNEKGKKHLERATTDNPTITQVFVDAATFHYLEGNMKEALIYIDYALKLEPKNSQANIIKAKILYQFDMFNEAFEQIKKLQTEMFSNIMDACLYMNLLSINKNPEYALIKDFGDIMRFGHLNLDTRIALGNIYYTVNNTEDAERYYEDALEINPSLYLNEYNVGNLIYSQGYYEEAKARYNHACSLSPNCVQSRLALAQIYRNEKNYREALAIIDGIGETIKLKKSNYEVFAFLGDVYLKNNMIDDAFDCFNKAISIDSTRADAYAGIALIHFNNRTYDTAMVYVNKALNIEPRNHELLLMESTIVFYRGYYNNYANEEYYLSAIKNLKMILKNDQQNITAVNVLMLIYDQMNQHKNAVDVYAEHTKKFPVDWIMHNTMVMIEIGYGTYLMGEGDTLLAKLRFKQALDHAFNAYEKSGVGFINNNIGAAFLYQDLIDSAFTYLAKYPSSVSANNVAVGLALQGDTLQALSLFEDVLKNDPTAWYAQKNISVLNGEKSSYEIGKSKRSSSRKNKQKTGLTRMFYFNFDVGYTFNLKLLPLFEIHDPEISNPIVDCKKIENDVYGKPNKYNRVDKIVY